MYLVYPRNGLILNDISYDKIHLVTGTPSSILSSQVILAVVDQDKNSRDVDLFRKWKVMRKVAQKAWEGAGNERSFIAWPARVAWDVIKNSMTIP